MDTEHLRFPVDKYKPPAEITQGDIDRWINTLEAFPGKMKMLTGALTEKQLLSRYREGGWTVRQIVHHVVDSHLNSYVRFKWALTEDNPTIKTYDQTAWGEQPDALSAPVSISLEFLSGLHARWVYFLRRMTAEQWERTFYHPEYKKQFHLKWLLGMYDWHCRHHSAHIELALNAPA